jgi:hypothetical protein
MNIFVTCRHVYVEENEKGEKGQRRTSKSSQTEDKPNLNFNIVCKMPHMHTIPFFGIPVREAGRVKRKSRNFVHSDVGLGTLSPNCLFISLFFSLSLT